MGVLEARQQAADTESQDSSVSAMVSTLIPTLIIASIYFTIFLVLRKSQRRFYAPRTYIGSLRQQERTPALPGGLFNWFGAFRNIPDYHALQHQSLDAYLFLRYLRICATICVVGLILTWPVLFAVNATGGGTQEGLNMLSYSNVDVDSPQGRNRLYAHVFLGWLFYGFVMYMILRECIFYINLRQAFLLSPVYANRISSRTVLFTSVPEDYLDELKIRRLFSNSVKNVWIVGDTGKLEEVVEERDKTAMKLESAEVKLIKLANKERVKSLKKGAAGPDEAPSAPASHNAEVGQVAARWVPNKKRPTHRLGKFGLYGKKVDTIDWCRDELRRLIPEAAAAQAQFRAGDFAKVGAVFVEFHTQSDAQAAYQVLTHHQVLRMSPRYIGVQPGEVLWKSLRISWWQKVIRRYAVIAFITALILFWAIPTAAVGAISQVSFLKSLSWLAWLDAVPEVIMGVISGLLPAVALAILMSLVPVVMRLCAKLAGEPSLSRVELFTQSAYFWFQLIQVFLITTISGSAVGAALEISQEPGRIFSILSAALPRASTFYISYFIVQGLTIASGVVSQVVGFIIFKLLYKFLANTPRAMYNKWATLSAISWGSVLPIYTTISVISIVYAVIAPLMLFWSSLGIFLFYLAYRYNILFVTDTIVDTRGLIYPRALKQLFAGVYLAEICMVGLFAVSQAFGPLVLMVAFLVFTLLFHLTISKVLDPLLYNLPRSLQVEEELLLAGSDAEAARPLALDASRSAKEAGAANGSTPSQAQGASDRQGNMITRFLKPWVYADYHTLRQLVPQDAIDFDQMYSEQVERDAYYPPSATSATPLLWIPSDPAGVSKDEIALTSKVIDITDEGCTIDEKNKLIWDAEGARPPIWDEKVYY
ncbi:DUF221-domain-containing protein [Sodiomyces alkalinus F11]|uniref:DUF221-domain-containing protein n=1 Tax=Sodiomyces alkalinus (strain CBS 110278 / VKM F-3762 / F11) TaxID=1314773 RepID=A0A3N2Q1V9_SODAK|nr:DUF221-domain-containing protein [Sodiomyces alkalinus F11]ROT40740.1 DUF221-domain-containing protein [Sodiomyces alkalinus F11]